MMNFLSNPRKKLSIPLVGILVTTVILAGLLVFSTMRNLNKEQRIIEGFLLDEGLTLIRSLEAGARTTMMHEMMGGSLPVKTLVRETAKSERIEYIFIVAEDGMVVASAGIHDLKADSLLTRKILEKRKPVTTVINLDGHKPVFEVATIFQSLPLERPVGMGMMGQSRWRPVSRVTKMLEEGRAVIHLGLCTKEFQEARVQDVRHSFFMGSLLLLLGSAGFYFLFLYQGMRVTRTTLANMKLYTRNIIESMPDGLITFDSRGRVVAWNPKAVELTGVHYEALKGLSMEALFPGMPVDSLAVYENASSFSYTFKDGKGGEIPVEISCSPLQDEEKKNRGAVFLLRDLRKIRAMEEQLARSHRLAALGKMAAGIAHEIRNPLGTLRGFAQYFGARAEDDASREYSSLMIGEVDRLNESISSLLQFSRPREPEFLPLELEDLLEKMEKLLEYDLKEKNIILEKSYTCSIQIEGDGDLLLQVLLNVLKNALNASETDGHISVTCENDDEHIYITVKDNGVGMSRVECEQMFDPFFTTRKTGTGLGLTVSHQIVEQHQGLFKVTSEQGKGTSVTIILPQRQREQ